MQSGNNSLGFINVAAGFALALSAVTAPAAAQPMHNSRGTPQAPAHQQHLPLPQATLEAQASVEVSQDTVTIYLSAQIDGDDRQQVDAELSRVLSEATGKAKGTPDIQLNTHRYTVWPNTDKKGAINRWRGQAELTLESKNFEAVSRLAASLSSHMSISRLAFSLSPQLRRQHEEALLEDAVAQFRRRASALASALGYTNYAIGQVALDQAQLNYQPAPRMMAMAVAADEGNTPVPLEAGTETVSVSVTGSVYLLANKAQPQPESSE